MPGSWPAHELPNLTAATCDVTSPVTNRYNCIAWAAGEDFRWWWPDSMGIAYWPPPVPREVTMRAFWEAFQTLGYSLCYSSSLEDGLEKVAIFGSQDQFGTTTPTHASLQLSSGKWSSKLGPFEDVCHEIPNDVSGPAYGVVVFYMSRPRVQ